MEAFIASFALIFLAELGDKTQLLAMAFSMKYGARKVLLGVFLATLLIQALAVGVGSLLAAFIPMKAVSVIASLSFIIFGIWILKGEKEEEGEEKPSRFGAVTTVVIAFFLAEMGDKTQLAAVSLAAEYKAVWQVLAGAVLGMVLADGAGILFGMFTRRHLSERKIKIASAAVFILFGLSGFYKLLFLK